ncbi:M10 family metallopeptidase C-terminal domain-containing protein, partial [Gemmobacter megaterium]
MGYFKNLDTSAFEDEDRLRRALESYKTAGVEIPDAEAEDAAALRPAPEGSGDGGAQQTRAAPPAKETAPDLAAEDGSPRKADSARAEAADEPVAETGGPVVSYEAPSDSGATRTEAAEGAAAAVAAAAAIVASVAAVEGHPQADGMAASPAGAAIDWASAKTTLVLADNSMGYQPQDGSACPCPMCSMIGDEAGEAGFGAGNGGDLSAPAAPVSLNVLGTYLNERGTGSGGNDFWDEFYGTSTNSPFFNLTNAGTNAKNGVLHYNVTSFPGTDANGVTAGRAEMIRHALNVYEDILGINFVETTSTDTSVVDIFFGDWSAGRAFANFNRAADGSISYSWINIDNNWDSGNTAIGTYAFQTALHEIGHVLGLGHQGLYNAGSGSPTYNDAYWQNDTWQQTMMSYWSQNNFNGQSYARLIGPMAVDWLVLDRIYGPQGYGISNGTTTGNTTWGFNGTWYMSSGEPLFGYANSAYASISTLLSGNAVSIVDGGGIDTLDLSGFSNNTLIDVTIASAASTTGTISNVAGLTGNLTLAVGTVIENVVGGSGNERIVGNTANNVLNGNAGNDSIFGGSGNDSLIGGLGNDSLEGGLGIDTLRGGDGNDILHPGASLAADEIYDGGVGEDTLNFANFGSSYTVNLGAGTFALGATSTTLVSIEHVWAGTGNDTIIGSSSNNDLYGGNGNDSLVGMGGLDRLYGGIGDDTLRAGSSLTTGEVYHGGGGTDTLDFTDFGLNYLVNLDTGVFSQGATTTSLVSIERVTAGSGNDTVIGSVFGDTLYGGSGNDSMDGGTGDDSLYGDAGNDTLIGGTGNDGLYGGLGDDSLDGGSGIDSLYGGDGNDTLTPGAGGISLGDHFDGGAGIDLLEFSTYSNNYRVDLAAGEFDTTLGGFLSTLTGIENVSAGNGNDSLTGDAGNNVLNGGGGNDTIHGGGGSDTLEGGAGNDTLYGGSGTDSLYGGDGNDMMILLSGDGTDHFYGGAGVDTVDVSNVSSIYSLIFNLGAGTMEWAGYAGTFDVIDVEHIVSAGGNDTIGGSAANNMLSGGDGDDLLNGWGGNDTLIGGAGNDTLNGGVGIDSMAGGTGDDTYIVDNAGDVVVEWIGGGTDTVLTALSSYSLGTLANVENLTGQSGAGQALGGNALDNVITGAAGSDTLNGWGGNDVLNGGAGDDLLNGGVGNDTLNGGPGNDTLNGGAGA